MRSTVQFFIFIAIVVWAFAAVNPVYNVTSGLEDYTLLVGRQMQSELDIGDLQLASVKARHADRLESIENQQQLVLEEIQKFDNDQLQQQVFSLSRKHCVQKYKLRVPTLKQANKNFTDCLIEADIKGERLTTNAEGNLKGARTVREVDLPGIFKSCNATYSGTALENCVTVNIDSKVIQFNKHMDMLQIRLHESLHQSSVIATEATRCSFVVEKKVLTTNGAVSDLADVCVEDLKKNGALAPAAIENGNVIESKLVQRLMSGRNLIT